MKQFILLFAIASLAICATETEHEKKLGPAHNVEDRGENTPSCSDLYVRQNGKWFDEEENPKFPIPDGVSDCVDLHLWDQKNSRYYDKCCYVRFQHEGNMHAGCIGLIQEYLNDSSETIKRMEQGDKAIWTRDAKNSKIYQLECNSSYLKYISLAVLLVFGLF